MKALVYDGPELMGFRDVPDPTPQQGEHLIRVESVGICGSDMHGYLGHDARRPAPLILGHEAAGVIVEGPRANDRVTINPLVPCGTCPACLAGRQNICPNRQLISMPPREGAFAQYLSMPKDNLVVVPDDVPLDKAALTEPMAVSWHAVRLALTALHPGMERRALVIGGGAIGVTAGLCLKAMGCTDVTVVEPNEARCAYVAERCGLHAVPTSADSFPVVIDAVGYAATRAIATERVEPGGVVAHIGLGDGEGGLDIRRMTLQEITFIGTYCYTPEDFRETAQAIFDGRLGPLDWFESRDLADGHQAFQELHAGQVAAPKIVLSPWA
ncbi:MAG: alcohol dehydrogenase catalytic domain-containing protein [Pseudomonadota bacterium]